MRPADGPAWLPRREDGGPLRIGHRGAAARAPANSLAGLEAALAAGLDGVELDVLAAGGRLVVAHSVRERTDASPALDEALALLADAAPDGFLLDLDLKSPEAAGAVVEALRRRGLVERALLSSFHPAALRTARAAEPRLATGISYPDDRLGVSGRMPEAAIRAGLAAMRRALPLRIGRLVGRAGADAAMLHHLVCSRGVSERCRARGVPVFAWTVNDPAALARVAALGVVGVITDDPAVFDRPARVPS